MADDKNDRRLADRAHVVQGMLSGVGFIGVNALFHGGGDQQVHGLATSTSIWVGAAMGVGSAMAVWPLVLAGIALLLIGLPIERHIRHYRRAASSEQDRRDLTDRP